jgi:regulatory protein
MAPERDPVEIAARALRHRDRSRREVDDRLARAGVEEDERADALDLLERVGYVDDARYAVTRAAALAGRGYGDDAIRAFLAGEGVAPEAVEGGVGALEPERERAARIAQRLGASARTAARLQRKGFGQDALESAFQGSFADEAAEDVEFLSRNEDPPET